MMKKLMAAGLVLAAAGLLGGCGSSKPKLKIYNAGEYINQDLLQEFKEKYDCKVIYETFESNEMMYTKINSGEFYDVLIPSDYMIERLINEKALKPVDWDKISNRDNLMPSVLNQAYDPGNVYSIPYFWGNVGILYDETVVDESDLKDGWNLLLNEKYKGNLYMYDSERDSFMVALKALGYSMNTTDEAQINEAYEWLVRQKEMMNPIYGGDEIIDNMISGNRAIAVVYSGDAAYMMSENPKLRYYVPEEGTNRWYDAMVISKECQNDELAYAFIDFMLEEGHAADNTAEIGYTSPVQTAYDEMLAGDYKEISAYAPRESDKDEVFHYQQPEVKAVFADLWTKVKSR